MERIVLTNNPLIIEEMKKKKKDKNLICENTYAQVLGKCENLLLEGWHFEVDPLGGYHFRPNPYHTIFLVKSCGDQKWSAVREWDAMNGMKMDFFRNQPFLEKYNKDYQLKDYQTMDYSIAIRSLERLEELYS